MNPSSESHEPAALEPEAAGSSLNADERMWAMFAHLAGPATVYLAGGMGWLGPLIVWLVKKESSRFIDDQGKESLNFQLNLLGQLLIGSFVSIILFFVTFGFAIFLLVPLWIAWGLYATIMPIIAGVAANGGARYRYPATIRIIK